MEASILLFIQEFIRNDIFTSIMVFITHLGDFGMIWIILTVIFLFFNKTRKIAYMMICALLLSLLINNGILKNSFLRIRPYETIEGLTRLIEAQSDFSFPSGHSASSFAGAVVIYKMVDKKYGIIAIILASLIAFSRLYVGVHYPTDVLVGILSGTCIAFFVIYMFKRYHFIDNKV